MNHTHRPVRETKNGKRRRKKQTRRRSSPSTRLYPLLVMKFALTLLLLLACLYVMIVSNCEPSEKHWAYGLLGSLVAYWFGVNSK